MNWVHPFAILFAAVVLAFLQSVFTWLRLVALVQPDLLPVLMVYAALNTSLPLTTATAVVGGVCFDALSSGPLGLSVIPLAIAGVVLHRRRDLLLRESVWAQALLGGAASVAVPVMFLALLYVLWPLLADPAASGPHFPEIQPSLNSLPPLGAGLFVQIPLMGVCGLLASPILFRFFRWIEDTFQYRRVPQAAFRSDREIQRGRH